MDLSYKGAMMRVIQGDLIALAQAGQFDVIVHGCNCYCQMGRGIAKSIREAFPAAADIDQLTAKADRNKLGTISVAVCPTELGTVTVVNAYTQFHWDGDGVEILANYAAIRSCLHQVQQQFTGQRIGLPKIGAGLARGDWTTIRQIIEHELSGEDVTLVEFMPA